MPSESGPFRRRARTIARLLLAGGLGLFLFSVFFYTAWFWVPGNGVALHSGRLSLIISVSNDPGRMKPGAVCHSTPPIVLFKPVLTSSARNAFVALPLWVVGIPGAILLGLDAWMLVRARRGRCAECGYSLAGLRAGAVCPECGHAPAVSSDGGPT